MKNFSQITENLDVANKKYIDDGLSKKVNTSDIVQVTGADITKIMSQKAVTDELDKKANRSGDTFTGDVIISSGNSLKTDIIKSADGTKRIAEITAAGLEIGGQGTPLRLYSSTRPIHANANKELAYTSDIPTNYVTTDTDQDIKGKKTVVPPSNKDNSNQIATTAWAGRRYKSIADFGFTSQTTVKAIVQKIIDNWYEYCTFACTNDNFNNFSDTPDGYGTLIIEVGSNALRPLISFTKQIGDSNSYKHWQANIVRGANNQVTEIQWYQIINDTLPQTISGEKTFASDICPEQNSGANLGKTAQRWNAVYAGNTGVRSTGNIICDSKVISYSAVESNKTVPDFNGILKDDLYTTAPTKTRGAQYLARDTNGAYIGGLRIYHDTNGTIQSQLLCRSQNTDVQNYVYFQAQPDATSNANKDKFAFIPHTNGNIDLGLSNNKWNNAHIQTVHTSQIRSSGDGKEYIACKSDGVELGYNDRPLRLYANSRPITAGSKIMVASDFSLSGTILTITLP